MCALERVTASCSCSNWAFEIWGTPVNWLQMGKWEKRRKNESPNVPWASVGIPGQPAQIKAVCGKEALNTIVWLVVHTGKEWKLSGGDVLGHLFVFCVLTNVFHWKLTHSEKVSVSRVQLVREEWEEPTTSLLDHVHTDPHTPCWVIILHLKHTHTHNQGFAARLKWVKILFS